MIHGRAPGFCKVDGVTETVNAGFSGSEYINSDNLAGASVAWQILAGEARTYNVEIRFANGGGTARSGDLIVNGTRVGALNFPATGAWTTWQMVATTITLASGANNLELVSTNAAGLANIDYIRIFNGPAAAGNCGTNPIPVDPFADGKILYGQQCAGCHGADGKGGAVNRPLVKCNLCEEADALINYIEVAMPPANPGACDESCAQKVTAYILKQFNSSQPIADELVTDVRVWRLTIQEYKNTLTRLFNLPQNHPWLEAPADRDSEDYYHTNSDFLQTDVTTARYFVDQSESIVWGLSDVQFTALMKCSPSDSNCVRDFTRDFASRAFRRPVSAEDAAIYEALAAGTTGLERYRRIAFGVLNSPYFIYRTEIGSEANINDQAVPLTNHEIASMLSYALLGQPPSAELLAAADSGSLSNPATMRSFANQMMLTPQAAERLHRFIRGWLLLDEDNWKDVSRDTETCGLFDSAKPALENEFNQFLRTNATMNDGLAKLLTAYFPVPSGDLQTFYASGNDAAGLGPQRQGVLASGMFAANHARFLRPSPVRRGVFIRERLLCQEFNVPDNVPPLMESDLGEEIVTNRDLYQAHVKDPACATCHQFFDPLGFTMESLDACGRYRSVDNGRTVDTSGEILGTRFDTALADIDDLSTMLADQQQVRECFTAQAFLFYRGLSPSEEPKALIEQIAESLNNSDRYSDVLMQLLTNPSLLTRKR